MVVLATMLGPALEPSASLADPPALQALKVSAAAARPMARAVFERMVAEVGVVIAGLLVMSVVLLPATLPENGFHYD
jgi:hypothetical protein